MFKIIKEDTNKGKTNNFIVRDLLKEEQLIPKERKEEQKKVCKEKKLEELPYDIIPTLRFLELVTRINTILDGYGEIQEDISYEQTKEIATDLTRIESSLENIEKTIQTEQTEQTELEVEITKVAK